MTFVVFHIKSGTKIGVYDSEQKARDNMRFLNRDSGWLRMASSYSDGIEMEWAKGPQNTMEPYDYAPYGFTEYDRWRVRFEPTLNANLVITDPDDNY